jgi:hypothetical protein
LSGQVSGSDSDLARDEGDPLACAPKRSAEEFVSEGWVAVGNAVSGRMRELGLTQIILAERSRVSVATIREIQRPKKDRHHNSRTLESLSEALEWPRQYLDDVLNGRPLQGTGEQVTETVPQSLRDILEQCLEKISVLEQHLGRIDALEQRLDGIADVVYSINSKFDVVIGLRHPRHDR